MLYVYRIRDCRVVLYVHRRGIVRLNCTTVYRRGVAGLYVYRRGIVGLYVYVYRRRVVVIKCVELCCTSAEET